MSDLTNHDGIDPFDVIDGRTVSHGQLTLGYACGVRIGKTDLIVMAASYENLRDFASKLAPGTVFGFDKASVRKFLGAEPQIVEHRPSHGIDGVDVIESGFGDLG